ncbi:hypothetical protein [Burkholderia diffusa]|uniref:hypothetical protein n=1 Tax=Burkholderia diffusa TaxID=488732 RepID=UPI002ABD87B9|nr:hypothetical protein [Burkholderia diffusa]
MVLLDCNLPDIDGYSPSRTIRQDESARKARYVSIIAISAITGDARNVCASTAGWTVCRASRCGSKP